MGFTFRGLLALVLLVRVAHADNPEQLKLADVVAAAVRQSPDFERAKLDAAAAGAALLTAEGVEDLHVGATASADANKVGTPTAFQAGASRSVVGELTASKVLPTGGTLALAAGSQYSLQDTTASTIKQYESLVTLSFLQPLLKGGGPSGYEAPIRQAEHNRDAAALARQARARDDLVAIAQAYWQLAFAWRQLEVRTAALDLAKQQLAYTQGAIRVDKLAQSDSIAVEEVTATRQQDVLAAEQEVLERSLAVRQLGGLEVDPSRLGIKTEPLPTKVPSPTDLDLAATVKTAFDHSAELAGLEAARHAAEAVLDGADAAGRSRLDLNLSAGVLGTDASSLSKSVSNGIDSPGYQVSASLTFDHAIGRRTERGTIATARTALTRAKVDERDARTRLAVRTTRAIQRAKSALASIALGEKAVGLAEQGVTAEQKKLELGKTNTFEVLRRQDELQQARLRHASSILDYQSARTELDGLTGAILKQYGITMQ